MGNVKISFGFLVWVLIDIVVGGFGFGWLSVAVTLNPAFILVAGACAMLAALLGLGTIEAYEEMKGS